MTSRGLLFYTAAGPFLKPLMITVNMALKRLHSLDKALMFCAFVIFIKVI